MRRRRCLRCDVRLDGDVQASLHEPSCGQRSNLPDDLRGLAEAGALEPAKHRVDRHRLDAISEPLLVGVVVEGDVGGEDPGRRAASSSTGAAWSARSPSGAARPGRARACRRWRPGSSPASRSPTGSTAGSGRTRGRRPCCRRRVEAGDAGVVGQGRRQRGLRRRREHHERRLVLPEVVEEELAQTLAIERSTARSALVQLVHDAPGPAARPRGRRSRGASNAGPIRSGSARHGRARRHELRSGRAGPPSSRPAPWRVRPTRRERSLFARPAGLGAAPGEGQRQAERGEARPARPAHRVILSL